MKLLSPIQIITNKERQISEEIQRLHSISNELANKKQDLNVLEVELESILEKQREQWIKEQNENIEKINSLTKEVILLEARKVQALIPLDNDKKEIEIIKEQVISKRKDFIKKEEDLDKKIELLEDKLSDINQKEIDLNKVSKKQALYQLGIETQKKEIEKQAKDFSLSIKQSLEEIEVKQKDIARKESEVLLKENTLNIKELKLNKTKKELEDKEIAIKRKYETLQRVIKHTKKNICQTPLEMKIESQDY